MNRLKFLFSSILLFSAVYFQSCQKNSIEDDLKVDIIKINENNFHTIFKDLSIILNENDKYIQAFIKKSNIGLLTSEDISELNNILGNKSNMDWTEIHKVNLKNNAYQTTNKIRNKNRL